MFYTPEWLARWLVAASVGAWLHAARRRLGLSDAGLNEPAALASYAALVDGIRVLDPACGDGALLLAAFARLLDERRWLDRAQGRGFDAATAAVAIIGRNLHGVDLQPDAIAAADAALRARAAELGATGVVAQLRVGDALLDASLAWPVSFPGVFAGDDPGFDCVVGNPPYVKLQELRRDRAELVERLVATYASARTGNFDLYLPFIERGVSLLARDGRLAYVTPSPWVINEHGEGLRGFVRRTRSLARWIDLRGYQAFPGAVTYTALQVFRRQPQPGIRCELAPRGPADLAPPDLLEREREPDTGLLDFASLPERGPWRLLPPDEARLHARLDARCTPLVDCCEQIAVGVQTSADAIFHLERVGPRRYRQTGANAPADELALEDALLHPLLSGAEVDRYRAPRTDTYLLLPYAITDARARLLAADELARDYPLTWAYLRRHEPALRARERGKMDRDDRWWGYNYPKNLAKQRLPKLVVAQTVPRLRVAYDERGEFCLNNVRVNGVYAADPEQAWFLLGVLNGPIADRVFRATAKPKAGGYYEANRQFIAPLPIPPADGESRRTVADRARRLQALHTRRAEALAELGDRLAVGRPGRTLALPGLDQALASGRDLQVGVDPRGAPTLREGENGPTVATVSLAPGEDPALTLAHWRHAVRTLSGRRLAKALRRLRIVDDPLAKPAIVASDARLRELEAEVAVNEAALDRLLARLYALEPADFRDAPAIAEPDPR